MSEQQVTTDDLSVEARDMLGRAAKALVRQRSSGLCDDNYPEACDSCDCFHAQVKAWTGHGFQQEHEHAAAVLDAALPGWRNGISREWRVEPDGSRITLPPTAPLPESDARQIAAVDKAADRGTRLATCLFFRSDWQEVPNDDERGWA